MTDPGVLTDCRSLSTFLSRLDAIRFRGSGSLAGVEDMLASLGSSLWGCRKGNVYASPRSQRCRRVGLGGRRRRWGWSVGSVVGTPYHASLTAHRQLCVARKANPLGAGTIPVTAQTCRRNNSSILLRLVRLVGLGGICFAQTVSESAPGGNRTHTISVNIDRKRHANR